MPRVVHASRAAWIALAALALVLLVSIVWMSAQLPSRDEMALASAAELDAMVARIDRLLVALVALTAVAALVCTVVIGRMARRTLATGEFPPPGTWVLVRTRVVTGRAARRAGWALLALAALSWLPVVAFAYARLVLEALAS